MRLAVVIVIAIAALFAGGVFYFLLQYMEGVERDALEFAEASKPGIDAVEVLVADIDLPAGTEIVSTILDWQPWPDDSLGDGYVVYNEEEDAADQSSLEEPFYDQIVRRGDLRVETGLGVRHAGDEGVKAVGERCDEHLEQVGIRLDQEDFARAPSHCV